jgi:hypothetical protein
MQVMALTHTGMTTDEFRGIVSAWMDSATHPRFGRPYSQMIYQPMLEYTTIQNPYPTLGMIIHHTDGDREYAYDLKSHIAVPDRMQYMESPTVKAFQESLRTSFQ